MQVTLPNAELILLPKLSSNKKNDKLGPMEIPEYKNQKMPKTLSLSL